MRLPGPDLLGLAYGLSEIALTIFKRSRGAVARADSNSLRVLWVTILASVALAIADDHRVIDDGPYRYVRHPSYTGVLIAFAGYGVCIGNWLSLLLLTVPIAFAFARRIQVEQAALLASLGEAYRRYAGRTRRLVPCLY